MTLLPDPFVNEMKELFCRFGMEQQWPSFLQSFRESARHGLRANTLKIRPDALRKLLAGQPGMSENLFCPVLWTDDGFYCPPDFQPGKLAAHLAGLYYIQEPSAMLPALVLSARPGERILDLCAAPGGKAARIAADLRGQGLLWANEISATRVRALQRNIELTGCTNAIITRETPQRLAGQLPGWFDAVLADVPCSGSGMFRRDPAAVKSWQAYGSDSCTLLQRDILESAWQMIRPGGRLVYSTCTFSLAENEAMIAWFCARHEQCRIVPIQKLPGVDDGLALSAELIHTARIWPHRAEGEGHFCALLEKTDGNAVRQPGYAAEQGSKEAWAAFHDFCRQTLSPEGQNSVNLLLENGSRRIENGHLHILPDCPAALAQLSKVKTGLYLGKIHQKGKQARFEPSIAFLLSLKGSDLNYVATGSGSSDIIRRCLRGETLSLPQDLADAVWPIGVTVAVALREQEGCWPLSWARLMAPSTLKNNYPSGWIRLL
ncbi:MAG: RsmF rRNA methyltransferase first C-terminal domain-containing protein [Bacillota bacterium]|nr:RsmF rRNA methyltransferase first C-terminal domain-containing protein [Bacillota bacterium]